MDERVCKHCGQLLLPGFECDCSGAQMEARTEMQKIKARQAIDELFGEHCQSEGYELSDEEEQLMDGTHPIFEKNFLEGMEE